MEPIYVISVLCVAGGFAMILFAYLVKGVGPAAKVADAIEKATAVVQEKAEAAPAGADAAGKAGGLGETAEQQSLKIAGVSEYVNALSSLAGNLSKLTPAIAALVISTILFFLAAALIATQEVQEKGGKKTVGIVQTM